MLDAASPIFFPARFEVSSRGEDCVYWAPDRRVAVKVGRMGAGVLDACRTAQTPAEVVGRMAGTLGLSVETVAPAVMALLERMVGLGFLSERPQPPAAELTAPAARYSPLVLYLHLSVHCNLSCVYCYNVEHRTKERHSRALTREEYLDLIDQAALRGVVQLNFTGGEPLLSPHWVEFAEHARGLGMTLTLLSNANLITPQNAPVIARLFANAIISLDSPDPAVHDRQRGRGSHARTMTGIGALRGAGFRGLVLRPVLTRHNLHTLADFPEFGRTQCGTTHFLPTAYLPNSFAEKQALDLSPDVAEYRAAMADFARAMAAVGGTIAQPDGDMEGQVRCGAGSGILSIDFNGDVYPCQAFHDPEMRLGNIRERDFFSIGEQSPQAQAVRDIHVGGVDVCATCSFNEVCGGGCRASAFKLYRSLRAHNAETCALNKSNAWDTIWSRFARAPEGGAIDPAASGGCGSGACSAHCA